MEVTLEEYNALVTIINAGLVKPFNNTDDSGSQEVLFYYIDDYGVEHTIKSGNPLHWIKLNYSLHERLNLT